MTSGALIVLAATLLAWAVAARQLTKRNLSGPLFFLAIGLLLANPDWGVVSVDVESSTVHTTAELTLALLLFADASRVRPSAARPDLPVTVRLLAVGLPLSIALGVGLGVVLFSELPLALVGFVAAALAPTDAALSASVIADERLPGSLRRILNVESGLNDGIATPVVAFCLAGAAAALGIAGHASDGGWRAVVELAAGALIGVAIGASGGTVLRTAHARGWMDHGSRRLGTLALALLAFLVAAEVGANPFVSAFVAGAAFGAAAGAETAESIELTELGGGLLALALWFVFGAGFVLPALEDADGAVLAYALCSLTVVRMAPVAVALVGAGLGRATTAFIGWFGPRGLASIVFALLAVEELGEGDRHVEAAVNAIVLTVLFSVVAHGLTARPLTARYVRARRADPPPGGEPPGAASNQDGLDGAVRPRFGSPTTIHGGTDDR